VVGQILIKKGVVRGLGESPKDALSAFHYFFRVLTNGYILSGLLSAFLGAMTWIAAVSRAPLSWLYPVNSLSFPLVVFFSWLLFKEEVPWLRVAGVGFILFGVVLVGVSGK